MLIDGPGARIATPYPIDGGTADLRERAVIIDVGGTDVMAEFHFAMLGRPDIAVAGTGTAPVGAPIEFTRGVRQLPALERSIRAALAGRLGVRATGRTSEVIPFELGPASPLTGDNQVFGMQCRATLADRTLYDVVARVDGDQWQVIAPHSVYARAAWHDFGLAHISDMHVARRIDQFPVLLEELGRHDAAKKMWNWNDRFRGFVRYANQLHDDGVLDVIVATGDLYDYLHEHDDDPAGDGNAGFLADLILGRAPGPNFPAVEELRVPIFMVPGNHDYRKNPYELLFNIDLGLLGEHQVKNYYGLHMLWDDALALQIGRNGGDGDDVPDLSVHTASRQIAIDEAIAPYRRRIADRGSYIVQLGSHRLAMLDSSWDVGVVDDIEDGLRKMLGMLSEDEKTFVGGSPNCEGVSDDELAMTAEALDATPDDGLFIVGIHAPLLNMPSSDYPFFFRETQRAHWNDEQIIGYLGQHASMLLGKQPLTFYQEVLRNNHPTWFENGPFVKRGDTQDVLDHGVSRGHADDLLRLLAGIGSRRVADVVLAGHTHRQNEFRVVRTGDSDIAFGLDFYTENPSQYYPTRFGTGWQQVLDNWKPETEITYVRVVNGAPAVSEPREMPYDATHDKVIDVPPYPTPLRTAADPAAWWGEHRPLVLQTGALGMLENSQVSFSGFRVLTVRSNVITAINHVSIERLHANDFRMPWADAIRPEVTYRTLLHRTGEHGAPAAAGDPNPRPQVSPGTYNTYYRDGDGNLHELWANADGSTSTANLSAYVDAPKAAGDPHSYLDATNQVVLYRGTDGHVHSFYWSTGGTGHDNLSAACGAPLAESDPVGYYDPALNVSHVYYRRGGSIEELWWEGVGAVGSGDIVRAAEAPGATGTPSAYMDTTRGDHIVVYRDEHAHVRSLYWNTGPVGTDDLSGVAGTPNAAGNPFAYYAAHADVHQMAYRDDAGRIWELYFQLPAPVAGWDVTAASGCPPAASDPTGFWDVSVNMKHIVYRGTDDHIYCVFWAPGSGTAQYVDLTLEALAPFATGTPTAFMVTGDGGAISHHVSYRGRDGQIYEIRW